ncbi:DUF2291 family protein [Salipaludibacillus neizhouensis]|nr:DUF2291 family protein [Salipaludibacillus neizhouensis]
MGLIQKVKHNMKVVLWTGGVTLLFLMMLITGSTIVDNEAALGSGSGSGDFSADEYVEASWESEVLPFMDEQKNELTDVLQQFSESDLETVGEEIGLTDGRNWHFIVTGKAEVLTIDTESRKGNSELDIEPYDGTADVVLQLGPVVDGYAIRDVLTYIKFDDFSNQIEWSQLAAGYNTKTYETNLEGLELEEGAEISLTGVLTVNDTSKTLTPVLIEEGGN